MTKFAALLVLICVTGKFDFESASKYIIVQFVLYNYVLLLHIKRSILMEKKNTHVKVGML